MPRTLTAADRSALIRLASTLPAGSDGRRAILAGLSLIAADYKTYVEKAKKDGKKPMEQDEWEARFGDKAEGKKKEFGKTKDEWEAHEKKIRAREPSMDEVNVLLDTKSEDVKALKMTDAVIEKAFHGKKGKANEFREMLDGLKGAVDDDGEGGLPKVFAELDNWIYDDDVADETPDAVSFLKSLRKKIEKEIGASHLVDPKHGGDPERWRSNNYGFETLAEAAKHPPTTKKGSALIRLASTLPAGSEERRAILAGLSKKAGLASDRKAATPKKT